MSDKLGIAIKFAQNAVAFEQAGKIGEACAKYHSAAHVLMDILKTLPPGDKKNKLKERAASYITRAEQLKEVAGSLEPCTISENGTGYSYESIFGDILTDATSVVIVEPYLDKFYQCQNLLRFVELCVKKGVASITVQTKLAENPHDESSPLYQIKSGLRRRGVHFAVEVHDTLHDRSVRADNGFIAHLGRGLHFFKRVEKFDVGYFDYSQRPCMACDITFDYKK
eukprot:m.78068 g.78068  ORF g.78068 m.78068 type:complete len:225 (+) comp11940_c3_seq5:175-849(+)